MRQSKHTFHMHAFRFHTPMEGNTFPCGKRSKAAAGYTRAQKREEPEPHPFRSKRTYERRFGARGCEGKARRTQNTDPAKRAGLCVP
jgi:hypothetical protein